MARVTHVKKAQQRYATKPVLDEDGNQKVVAVLRKDGTPKTTKHGREITRRVTVADKARPLANLKCEKCGKEIAVGDPYKHISPKSGPYGGRQRNRCEACPMWRPSETTGSAALAEVYGAQEAASDAISEWDGNTDDLRSILDDAAEGLRSGAEVWRESASNIEDGFGHPTYQSEELNERADTLDSSADELANVDLEEWDEDAARSEVEADVLAEYLGEIDDNGLGVAGVSTVEDAITEVPDFDAEVYESRVTDAIEEKKNEWADEQREAADSAIYDIEIP